MNQFKGSYTPSSPGAVPKEKKKRNVSNIPIIKNSLNFSFSTYHFGVSGLTKAILKKKH